MTLSKSKATKMARSLVQKPVGQGTSWQVTGPWHSDIEGIKTGITTTKNAIGYQEALKMRTFWVCALALSLMGFAENEYVLHQIEQYRDFATINDIMTEALNML